MEYEPKNWKKNYIYSFQVHNGVFTQRDCFCLLCFDIVQYRSIEFTKFTLATHNHENVVYPSIFHAIKYTIFYLFSSESFVRSLSLSLNVFLSRWLSSLSCFLYNNCLPSSHLNIFSRIFNARNIQKRQCEPHFKTEKAYIMCYMHTHTHTHINTQTENQISFSWLNG